MDGALALLITAILATLVLYFWARKAQLEKQLLQEREENERILSVAEDLQNRLGALQNKKDAAPLPMGLDVLERLFEQYYVYEGTDALQPRIFKEVNSLVGGLRSNPAVQQALEESVNAAKDQVMSRLRAAFPRWKEEDYLLYLFAAAGFSSTTISALLEKDKPYVYNRIYRLKERIKVSCSPQEASFFLSCLNR